MQLVAPEGFVHLRVRSRYSLLESSVDIGHLLQRCKSLGMPAAGIVDTNNMHGSLEFAHEAVAAGVQPIHGCSVSLLYSETWRNDPVIPAVGLLAMDSKGYQNLLSLNTCMYLDERKAVPHLRLEELERHSDGLICLTGGASGAIGSLLAGGRARSAGTLLGELGDIFQDRLYVELQRHRHEGTTCLMLEEKTEYDLVRLAYEQGLPLVATNDVHFLDSKSYEAVDLLFYIKHGGFASQQDKRRLLTREHGLKSPREMAELFTDLPEAIENTLEIARRCSFNTSTSSPMLPQFSEDEDRDLRDLAESGLNNRLELNEPAAPRREYSERLDYELDVIRQIGFSGYFLIVRDFVVWAKDNGIPVGPGRGSGAGSLVAYALRITNLDPIRYSLLFERFLNPERDSIPDFDIDFCQENRDRVIDYVRDKYGKDRVAQIITFGSLGAKGSIRDYGRILRIPRAKLNALSAEVDPRFDLRSQRQNNEVLASEEQGNPEIRTLFGHIEQIEGLPRNPSRHAAGIVIGNQPLDQILPLYNDDPEHIPVTQFDMKWVEKAGLVKMDFLGLKTLSVIRRTLDMLRSRGIDIDIDATGFDDPDVFELYASGNTVGVFQVEGAGMIDTLRMMKPSRIEDIIALVALYRPGPMENIPAFCQVKNGEKKSRKYHELIDDLLEETNGIIVYQEQVMEIARRMGGYSLGRADILRRAMGKKQPEEMAREKPRFIEGALQNGVTARVAESIWDLLAKFASYGFNKSHAAVYAAVSYQTAWLKTRYPCEFMASVMTYDIGDSAKIAGYVRELARLEIKMEPPCVNRSGQGFTAHDNSIFFALDAIKNVGTEAARMIARARGDEPFADMFDFASRVNLQMMNRSMLEHLAMAGAFDCLEANRKSVHASIDRLIAYSRLMSDHEQGRQDTLFGELEDTISKPELQHEVDWPPPERLANEHMTLGMYLTGHPLDEFESALTGKEFTPVSRVSEVIRQGVAGFEGKKKFEVKVAGVLSNVTYRSTRTGKRMAIITLFDRTDNIEAFVFPKNLEETATELAENRCISAYLEVNRHNDRLTVSASLLRPLSRGRSLPRQKLGIHFTSEDAPSDILNALRKSQGGESPDMDAAIRLVPLRNGMKDKVEIVVPERFMLGKRTLETISGLRGVAYISDN